MIFSMAFLGAITVQAEDEMPVDPVVYDEGMPVPELILEEELEEVKVPSNIGLWWIGVKESFSMTFTFNPEKRVEKALAFADRRMELAEAFAQSADTEEAQAKAERMIAKAESFVEKAEAKKSEVAEKLQERLTEQKAKIEERKQKIQEFNEERAGLIQKIKDGDEEAKEELAELNKDRREDVANVREDIKEVREEQRVGGDKDEHGCIGSAGYLWCEAKEACLQPWEEEWDDSCDLLEKPKPANGFKPLDSMIKDQLKKAKGFLNQQ